ncbi:MAG TPA: ASPIC/UnbV domain-containing protein, partial [Pirellulales bacterium]|nr:ASPIC/UnbV domain-containing protein [Pirellulales bacterium]
GGRFAERPAEELGDYFQGKYLGRGLARLDWNRDGREDFVVSHLDRAASLVTNQTSRAGHFLAVQLRGVASSRDAIGAVVTIESGGKSRRQWLAAGDGFLASNQRQLVFGLGPNTRVERLSISWPSGAEQEFLDLAADREWIFVENSPRATALTPAR